MSIVYLFTVYCCSLHIQLLLLNHILTSIKYTYFVFNLYFLLQDPCEASLIPPTVSETILPVKNDDCVISKHSEKDDIKEKCDSPLSDTEDLTFVSTTLKSILKESPEQCQVIKKIYRYSSTFKCSYFDSLKEKS